MGATSQRPLDNSIPATLFERAGHPAPGDSWRASSSSTESQYRRNPESEQAHRGHPTVLVVGHETESRSTLIHLLQNEGYLVLDALDGTVARKIAVQHSRPIHVLLIAGSMEDRLTATDLQQFRQGIWVLFVALNQDHALPDELTPEAAVEQVRAFFNGPKAAASAVGS